MTKAKAKKIISERTPICRIISMYNYGDCWDIVGEVGGDVLHYRLYNNGDLFER